MCLIFVGQGQPQNFFNLENFPNYGICYVESLLSLQVRTYFLYISENASYSITYAHYPALLC